MKLHKSITRFFVTAIILSTAVFTNCVDVPRDNAADKQGDNYSNVYADKRITSFSFVSPAVSGIIDEANSTIIVPVLYGTDVENLAAEFTTNAETVDIYGREQRSGITVNDFSEPLYYAVTARDGSSREYTVSTEFVIISSFSLSDPALSWVDSASGIIDHDLKTISVGVPYYMDITNLVASFDAVGDVSENGIMQVSGITEKDFSTNTFTYQVADENGVTQDYTVTVDYKAPTVAHLAGSLGGAGSIDGTGNAAAFRGPTKMTCDLDNIYVADTTNHTIRKIEKSTGIVTTLAGSPGEAESTDGTGSAARFRSPQGITTDGTNLYVADTSNNKIRKIVISTGEVSTIAGTGAAGSAEDVNGYNSGISSIFDTPRGITTDGTNLYVADTTNHTIRKIVISSGVVSTFAGLADNFALTNGTGTAARFYFPYDITTDGTNLYVADSSNCVIRQITIAGAVVTTLAGSGTPSYLDSTTGSTATFNGPQAITTDRVNLYVNDIGNNRIRQISLTSPYAVTTLSGTGSDGSVDGVGTAASFYDPAGITADGTSLYVADTGNNTIRKILLANRLVGTFAGIANESGYTNSTGTDARFSYPDGLTVQGGILYVADLYNHRIRQIGLSSGTVNFVAGLTNTFADGLGTIAKFSYPEGITTDGTYLYVADRDNSRIRKIVITSNAIGDVTTIAGTNSNGFLNNTIGTSAQFWAPQGITSDGTSLYVADTGNYCIRKVELTAPYAVTTFATGFFTPTCITADDVNLYLSDTDEYKIYKIVISTQAVTLLAGSTDGYEDGIGADAQFSAPRGLAADGTNLYVADSGNHVIRKINIATQEVTTIAGTGEISGSTDGSESALFNLPYGITFYEQKLYVSERGNHAIRVINP